MSIADKDLQRREIITKAVCGKGRKFSTVTHTVIPPNGPTSILGLGLSTTNMKPYQRVTELKLLVLTISTFGIPTTRILRRM